MINELEIKNFLSLAETKIKLTEQVKKYYGKEFAPNFNSFDFWEIDENKVSLILSFFLNPYEAHEHGDIYLRHFLKKFDLDFFQFNDNDKINVQCEYSTDKGRRIDVIIHKNDFEQAIAIENKIYVETSDQENQISDYLYFLAQKTKNNFCLLYLSPKAKTVSNQSISAEQKEIFINQKKLKFLTYEEQMIECISDFANITQNFRVKSFLKDFEKTLRKMYMGEKNINTTQVIVDLLRENEKNLKISFLISNSLQELKRQLKEEFEKQIQEIGKELNLEVDGLKLRPSNWQKNRIAFHYESGNLLYGIVRINPDKSRPRFIEIENFFETKMNVRFNTSEWWAIWQFFYKNIENNEQFWIDITTGKAKEQAKEFVKLICDNFNKENKDIY